MSYKVTQNYFKVVDETIDYKRSLIMCSIGFLLFLFIGRATFVGLVGLALMGLGVYLVVSRILKIKAEKDSIPTDKQYDTEVVKKISNLREQALNKLCIDEEEVNEIDPICFDGYVYQGASKYKCGQDNFYRTNKYEAVILFFSNSEVHRYTYTYSTTEEKKVESTEVYFYRDIVSVSTSTEEVRFGNQTFTTENFKLITAGGTAFTVSLRDTNNAQRSINAMRALLREKKQS